MSSTINPTASTQSSYGMPQQAQPFPVQAQQQQGFPQQQQAAATSFSQPGVQQWANQQQPLSEVDALIQSVTAATGQPTQQMAPQQPAAPQQYMSEVDREISDINKLTTIAPTFMQQQQAGLAMDEKNKQLQQQNNQLKQQITMLQNGLPANVANPTGDASLGLDMGSSSAGTDPLQGLSSTPPGTTPEASGSSTTGGQEDLSQLVNGAGYADAAAQHATDATSIFNTFQDYAVKADTLYKMKNHFMEEAYDQGMDPASFEGQRYVKQKLEAVVAKDPTLKPAFDKMSLQYTLGQPPATGATSTVLPSTQQAMKQNSPPASTASEPLPQEEATPRSATSVAGANDPLTTLASKLTLRAELLQQLADGKITQKEFDEQTGGQTFAEFTNRK